MNEGIRTSTNFKMVCRVYMNKTLKVFCAEAKYLEAAIRFYLVARLRHGSGRKRNLVEHQPCGSSNTESVQRAS